jgi:subtilisin family serine protease
MSNSIRRFLRGTKRVVVPVVVVGMIGMAAMPFSQAAVDRGASGIVPGQYIIVMKDGVADGTDMVADQLERSHRIRTEARFYRVLRGFTATLSDAQLAEVKNDPRIAAVVPDRIVEAFGPTRLAPSFSRVTVPQPAQVVPTGVARIGAATDSGTGAGVTVAVIDTGINLSHPDLKANIVANKNCLAPRKTGTDDNGHGTHVAGTIAALDNSIGVVGVAPQAKLAAVKVLNSKGAGTWSSVICGIDWVTQNAARYGITVANMSLGGAGVSDGDCGATNADPLHQAICRSRDAGITYVVAGGNNGADASGFVPAAYTDAVIAVSALADSDGIAGGSGSATTYGPDDTFATFSNYGNIIPIGAPGVGIRSTWLGTGYATLSGTSMAAPHVAGVVALYGAAHPGVTWTAIRDALVSAGEVLGAGHSDPSGVHPEPVVRVPAL